MSKLTDFSLKKPNKVSSLSTPHRSWEKSPTINWSVWIQIITIQATGKKSWHYVSSHYYSIFTTKLQLTIGGAWWKYSVQGVPLVYANIIWDTQTWKYERKKLLLLKKIKYWFGNQLVISQSIITINAQVKLLDQLQYPKQRHCWQVAIHFPVNLLNTWLGQDWSQP